MSPRSSEKDPAPSLDNGAPVSLKIQPKRTLHKVNELPKNIMRHFLLVLISCFIYQGWPDSFAREPNCLFKRHIVHNFKILSVLVPRRKKIGRFHENST